jgi:chemotaxis protein CheY-P-specific phosphatase CheC
MSEEGLSLGEKETVTRLLEAGVTVSTDRLGKMSGTQWGVMSSSIKEMPVVRMLSWFTRSKTKHYAVRFISDSSVPLEFLILFTDKSAQAVTGAVTRKYADKMAHLKNLVELTIGEVSNVVAQSVLGVLADEYDASIILSVPSVSSGEKAELMAKALETYDARKDTLLLSHVDMYSENLAAECSMVIIVNTEDIKKLLSRPVAS